MGSHLYLFCPDLDRAMTLELKMFQMGVEHDEKDYTSSFGSFSVLVRSDSAQLIWAYVFQRLGCHQSQNHCIRRAESSGLKKLTLKQMPDHRKPKHNENQESSKRGSNTIRRIYRLLISVRVA